MAQRTNTELLRADLADAYAEATLLGEAVDQYRSVTVTARAALASAAHVLQSSLERGNGAPYPRAGLIDTLHTVRTAIAAIDALGSP